MSTSEKSCNGTRLKPPIPAGKVVVGTALDEVRNLLETKRMTTRRLGIVMHGVTGRMGLNQHLIRSIVAIRRDGGVALRNGDRVMPDPILVGRDESKLKALAQRYEIERFSTDLEAALSNPN